ncbi:MAG TPA: DNA internalization-related competence protein ComEC/Rec2, partial [Clostridiales bacterium]|nr:DNA internalization-related competence protein ComEC/Rec2 [Clostridiales bacterium]
MVTGAVPSVLRAATMLGLLIIAPLLNRKYDSLSAIAVVALFLLIINPLLIFHVGFQLSFAAVLSIVLLYPKILEKITFLPPFWAQSIAVIISAQIGTIPIVAYHFHFISIAAFFINIPIVLLAGYVMPLGLITIVSAFIFYPLSVFLGKILFILLKIMVILTELAASMPMASVQTVSPSIFFVICYYFFLFIISAEKCLPEGIWVQKRKKLCGLLIALYLAVWGISYLFPQNAEVIFVDVGQGDCTVIRTPKRKTILIDGGGNYDWSAQSWDVGEDVLVPFLLRNGIRHIDMVILSHPHRDHIGGLLSVFSHLKVDILFRGVGNYESEDLKILEELCKKNHVQIYLLQQGDQIQIEKDIHMEVLFPEKWNGAISDEEANNHSLVCLIRMKGIDILFTGDIEKETEMKLTEKYPDLRADILKAAHHGSNTSNTEKWIRLLRPRMAVIQVGKNLFGHPSQEVLERFEQNHIYVFRNDQDGAILLQIEGQRVRVKTTLKRETES